MPFRHASVSPVQGQDELLVTAVPGDLEIWASAPGSAFSIGGPDSAAYGVYVPMGSVFHTRVRPGDELYIHVSTMPNGSVNALIRSA